MLRHAPIRSSPVNERQRLAELLRPTCPLILEQVIYEACLSGDQARIPAEAELRFVLDQGAQLALRAIALPTVERRAALRTLVEASRAALDRLAVPAIARLGLSRIGMRHARATVERAARERIDGAALIREFAIFEGDLAVAMQDVALVAVA